MATKKKLFGSPLPFTTGTSGQTNAMYLTLHPHVLIEILSYLSIGCRFSQDVSPSYWLPQVELSGVGSNTANGTLTTQQITTNTTTAPNNHLIWRRHTTTEQANALTKRQARVPLCMHLRATDGSSSRPNVISLLCRVYMLLVLSRSLPRSRPLLRRPQQPSWPCSPPSPSDTWMRHKMNPTCTHKTKSENGFRARLTPALITDKESRVQKEFRIVQMHACWANLALSASAFFWWGAF